MAILVDDAGSFSLPKGVSRELFDNAYDKARQVAAAGEVLLKNESVHNYFMSARSIDVIDSFE